MDLIDKHRTFLFIDEPEHGARNPPTHCRKTRTVDPMDMLVPVNSDGSLDLSSAWLSLDGDAGQESDDATDRQPGIRNIGRVPQLTMGYDGEPGAFNRFEAMRFPEFTRHTMVTWDGQAFEAFSTMWEGMHSPLTFKNSKLTPVVDDCGLVIGYFQQGVSTKLLYTNDQGEIYYSNQYGSHLMGLESIDGRDLWLSAAGKVLTWSESSQNLNA